MIDHYMRSIGDQVATILNQSQDIAYNVDDGCETLRQLIAQYDVNSIFLEFLKRNSKN